MINEKGERALAHVEVIANIEPIPNADKIEVATVLGWRVVVGKGEFSIGDKVVYIEVDSKVPEREEFEFLRDRKFKVKTIKLRGQYSQGLIMPFSILGRDANIGEDVTAELGIKYSVAEDNARKSNGIDPNAKYLSMRDRHKKLFKKKPFKFLMKYYWGRRLLFVFFGKKKDNPRGWPTHIAKKTDVERIQNMPHLLGTGKKYVATEKIDGSSCSVMAERKRFGRIKQYVCSRNVVFQTEKDKCFYDNNIYFEVYNKYNLKEKIVTIMNELNASTIALQMEVYGPSVQKRDYSLSERQAMIFHIVVNGIKIPMDKVVEVCEKNNLPHVPIIDYDYTIPNTIEEIQAFVESEGSKIDGKIKEGIVFYDKETGQEYFKFVSPKFLMQYHQ